MEKNEKKEIEFPVRLFCHPRKVEVIRLPRYMGGQAKIFLRNVGKEISEYHYSVYCQISGRTDNGKEIPIDNVGKWLFGVPGYMGHIRVCGFEGHDVRVEWPESSPEIVHKLVAEIKKQVESGRLPESARRVVDFCKQHNV